MFLESDDIPSVFDPNPILQLQLEEIMLMNPHEPLLFIIPLCLFVEVSLFCNFPIKAGLCLDL